MKLFLNKIKRLSNYDNFVSFVILAMLSEVVINLFIISKVAYTEIDWKAYMDQIDSVYRGTYDYELLKGDTGPLVYPGGFVVIYYMLYLVTSSGDDIAMAQYIFAVLYLFTIGILFLVYKETKRVPLWGLILISTSRRVHSIFVLRLFNDCFAMFFLYLAIYCFLKERWNWGCFFYSFAVGTKMNIFLFAPGLFIILLRRFGVVSTFKKIFLCFVVQVVLAVPFAIANFRAYIGRAFNLGRIFIYYWSVNWKFIPEQLFIRPEWGFFLLILTLVVWFFFASYKWTPSGLKKLLFSQQIWTGEGRLTASYIVSVLFISNFIGIVFSRSLHYQFYVWYYHTLPYLLWQTDLHTLKRLGLLAVIEIIWNIFPSNAISSLVLFVCHFYILYALWKYYPTASTKIQPEKKIN